MIIPFVDIGTDQLAESAVGDPGTAYNVKFKGNDGTVGKEISANDGDNVHYCDLTLCDIKGGV